MINAEQIALLSAFQDGKILPDNVVHGIPNVLGSGCWGYAYEFDDTVYKVTTSITEAIYALQMMDKAPSHTVDIHSVKMYDDEQSLYFVIVQEKVITHEDDNQLQLLHWYFNDVDMDFSNDPDYVIEANKKKGNPLSDATIKMIENACFMYDSLLLAGFYNVDLHDGNLGIREKHGQRELVCFDQMNLELEDKLGDEYLCERDIFSILERNLSPDALTKIEHLRVNDVFVLGYLDELNEYVDDLVNAFSTELAFSYLPDGDWLAGGCKEFAMIAQEELNQAIREEGLLINELCSIEAIRNRSTGNDENFYLAIGPLCIDAGGIHNRVTFIEDFVRTEAPHLTPGNLHLTECDSHTLSSSNGIVDVKALKSALDESGLLLTNENNDNQYACAL